MIVGGVRNWELCVGSFVKKKFNFVFGKLNSLSLSHVVFLSAQIYEFTGVGYFHTELFK